MEGRDFTAACRARYNYDFDFWSMLVLEVLPKEDCPNLTIFSAIMYMYIILY